jgi:opacity protein-like surface antigen
MKKKAWMVNFFVCLLSLTLISEVCAKQTKRAGKWEASLGGLYSTENNTGADFGSNLNIEDDFGWNLSVGYNVNPHLLLNFEWQMLKPTYTATYIDAEEPSNSAKINNKMDLYNSQFNAIYNFSTDSFTPFIQAGVGWSFIDSKVSDGPPQGGCWYDPWWGIYICDGFQPTYHDDRFTYNVAAGFRYELDNYAFIKVSYQQLFVDMVRSASATSMGVYHLEVGSIF